MRAPFLDHIVVLVRDLDASREFYKAALAQGVQPICGIDCWLTFQREGSDVLLPYVLGVDELVSQSALMIFADGPTVAIVETSGRTWTYGEYLTAAEEWRPKPDGSMKGAPSASKKARSTTEAVSGMAELVHGADTDERLEDAPVDKAAHAPLRNLAHGPRWRNR
mgnify:CR=1 FL=1